MVVNSASTQGNMSSSQTSAGDPASVTCICQPTMTHRNTTSIACSLCAKLTPLACLLHRYTGSSGAAPLRNSLEWLQAFLSCCDFKFVCFDCQQTSGVHGKSAGSSVDNSKSSLEELVVTLRNLLLNINVKIDKLQNDINNNKPLISNLMDCVEEISLSDDKSSSNVIDHPACSTTGSTSYAHVLSKNISDVVKNSVAESLKQQKMDDIENSSFVVFGFPEDRRDYFDLHELMEFLNCRGDIVSYSRIGRVAKLVQGRPLKVVLRLATDCEYVLTHANLLRKNDYYSGVYLSRWLSKDEMNKLKVLRLHCEELNKTCASDVKGRKPYLIISGKLMKRESGGKLIKVNDCVSSAAQESVSQPYVRKKQQIKSQSATQPKNAPGGSHVAP